METSASSPQGAPEGNTCLIRASVSTSIQWGQQCGPQPSASGKHSLVLQKLSQGAGLETGKLELRSVSVTLSDGSAVGHRAGTVPGEGGQQSIHGGRQQQHTGDRERGVVCGKTI